MSCWGKFISYQICCFDIIIFTLAFNIFAASHIILSFRIIILFNFAEIPLNINLFLFYFYFI